MRGQAGDGWLELTAADDHRFSLFIQGQNWGQSKEVIRIGELTDWQSAGLTGYGIAIGDFETNEFLRFSMSDLKFYLSGTFSAANNLVKLWRYGLDVFTIGAGIRFFRALTDNLPVGKIQLAFDLDIQTERGWMWHISAINVVGGISARTELPSFQP